MYHEITMKSSLREVYAHPVGHDNPEKNPSAGRYAG